MKSSDPIKFDGIIAEFDALQEASSKIRAPTDNAEASHFIRTVLIPEWERRMLLAAQTQNLKLSGDKESHRDYLLKWVDLNSRRMQAVELQISAIERNEDDLIYEKMIKVLDEQIAKLNGNN
jgi:hypothetical protein